jgi:hypothetical protein
MISDRILNVRSASVARSWVVFGAVFLALAVLRYIETREWITALMAPLTLTGFIGVTVFVADTTEAIRSRYRVKGKFYVLFLGTILNFAFLWFLGASLQSLVILLLLGIFFFGVLFVLGGIKRRLRRG